ncbi:hsp70-binding protein 1 isoform X2 [Pangasianodon hypophthalmus]|uniref:hsp70-binding protein 1 isoform X2 n=1 Tax=Pangasianodon hypophthalmus TaxID=310915 RepID=UPI00147D409C|nr:hsp70-binding protein 1 isoform X2 [Pangasianodon hypophthalmus]
MAEGNRRQPQNLQGVLRLAVEAGSASDGSAPNEPMSQERIQFLRGALSEVCKGQLDEVEQMKRCVSVLMQDEGEGREDEEDEDEKEAALEMLCDLCDNLDNARDLMKLGGLDVCVSRCVCHTEAGLRWRAAELLACCAQNMPEVQLYLLQQGALHTLLQLTDHDPHPTVRVKALYAVSCLVREQEVGLRDFLSHDGFSVLMRGMQSDCEKLRTKSAFLLLNLLTSHPEHRVLCMGMVQQLVAVLRSPHSSVHEHVLGVLCCLVEDSERGVCDCKEPSLGLEELLNQRIQELQGREESQEEVEFCERLRAACFRAQPQEDNAMDR